MYGKSLCQGTKKYPKLKFYNVPDKLKAFLDQLLQYFFLKFQEFIYSTLTSHYTERNDGMYTNIS